MDTKTVGTQLVAFCNAGENAKALDTLYHNDIYSVEVSDPMREIRGIDGVRGKAKWWFDNHDVHSGVTRGPWINGDTFVVEHTYDITFKPTGVRHIMNETAIYKVRDGKIVEEHFLSPA